MRYNPVQFNPLQWNAGYIYSVFRDLVSFIIWFILFVLCSEKCFQVAMSSNSNTNQTISSRLCYLHYLHCVLRIIIPSTAYLQASDASSNCNGNNNNAKNVKNPGSNYSVRIS